MNLKRIIIDTDNGERFIYEDFHIDNYVEIGEERYSPPWLAQVADKDSWAFDLRLRAGKLTVTEALPGDSDYDWLLENYKRVSDELLKVRQQVAQQREAIAVQMGFRDIIDGLNEQIDYLRKENERLRDIIDSHWDGDW